GRAARGRRARRRPAGALPPGARPLRRNRARRAPGGGRGRARRAGPERPHPDRMMRDRRPLRMGAGMTASIRRVAPRPVWALARVGLRVEDELRRLVTGLLAQAVEEAIARTLRSELIDVLAREIARYEVVERVSQPLLAGPALERVLDQLD